MFGRVEEYDIIVAFVLAIWFLLSIVGQFQVKSVELIRKYDLLRLIPMWTFFAPNPGHTDYHLLYRDKSIDDSIIITPWQEIPLTTRRGRLEFLWNPFKRETKVVSDAVHYLCNFIELHLELQTPIKAVRSAIMLSTPYFILLGIVTSRGKKTQHGKYRQFALAESFGFNSNQKPNLILCSAFHPLKSGKFTRLNTDA
jgi:hypothetical protein